MKNIKLNKEELKIEIEKLQIELDAVEKEMRTRKYRKEDAEQFKLIIENRGKEKIIQENNWFDEINEKHKELRMKIKLLLLYRGLLNSHDSKYDGYWKLINELKKLNGCGIKPYFRNDQYRSSHSQPKPGYELHHDYENVLILLSSRFQNQSLNIPYYVHEPNNLTYVDWIQHLIVHWEISRLRDSLDGGQNLIIDNIKHCINGFEFKTKSDIAKKELIINKYGEKFINEVVNLFEIYVTYFIPKKENITQYRKAEIISNYINFQALKELKTNNPEYKSDFSFQYLPDFLQIWEIWEKIKRNENYEKDIDAEIELIRKEYDEELKKANYHQRYEQIINTIIKK